MEVCAEESVRVAGEACEGRSVSRAVARAMTPHQRGNVKRSPEKLSDRLAW